jgi:hypothetical protein
MIRITENAVYSNWWSAHLPKDWHAEEDSECVTLSRNGFPSALQLSAARKENTLITDDELRDFAGSRLSTESASKANTGAFSGFYAERTEDGVFWREWWLRAGHLMIFASYNIVDELKDSEKEAVDAIIRSLIPRVVQF